MSPTPDVVHCLGRGAPPTPLHDPLRGRLPGDPAGLPAHFDLFVVHRGHGREPRGSSQDALRGLARRRRHGFRPRTRPPRDRAARRDRSAMAFDPPCARVRFSPGGTRPALGSSPPARCDVGQAVHRRRAAERSSSSVRVASLGEHKRVWGVSGASPRAVAAQAPVGGRAMLPTDSGAEASPGAPPVCAAAEVMTISCRRARGRSRGARWPRAGPRGGWPRARRGG